MSKRGNNVGPVGSRRGAFIVNPQQAGENSQVSQPSVVLHSDDILSRAARARATLARMSSALAVHVKDSGFWLCSAM